MIVPLYQYKKLLEKHEKILSEWCYEIYEETEDYDIRNVNILVGTQMIADIEETDVLFEHQQEKIISEINNIKRNIDKGKKRRI